MPPSLEPQWLAAREHEARREFDAARAIYRSILDTDPTQAFAWHRLSAVASVEGHYRDARTAALTGVELALQHRRWRALPWLTQQLLAFDERAIVQRAIEGADWTHPAILAQSAVLAQQLWLADAHATGLRLADCGLATAPRSHLLHYVRANLLRNLGRGAEATAAFETALSLAPGFGEAHWALATRLWLPSMRSSTVVPVRGMPTMNTGVRRSWPAGTVPASGSGVAARSASNVACSRAPECREMRRMSAAAPARAGQAASGSPAASSSRKSA